MHKTKRRVCFLDDAAKFIKKKKSNQNFRTFFFEKNFRPLRPLVETQKYAHI
jgi:hypothetical protein